MAGTLKDLLSGGFRRDRMQQIEQAAGGDPSLRRPSAVSQPPPVRGMEAPAVDIDAINAATRRRRAELEAAAKKRKKKPTLSAIEARIAELEAQLGL